MLIALIPFFSWAIGDFLAVFVTRKIGGYAANYWSFIFALVGLTFLIPGHIGELASYSSLLLAANLVLGVLFLFGNSFYARSLERSNASLSNVVAGAFPVVTILIAFLLGERVNTIEGLGITLAVLGVVIATLNFSDLKSGISLRDPSIRYAFYAMLCWGTFYALIKPITEQVGWFWPAYISYATFPVIAWWLKHQKISFPFPLKNGLAIFLLLLLATLLVRGGEVVFNVALESNLSSIVTPLAGSYPVLFVVLAALFLKERLLPTQWMGVGVGLAGIVVLAAFGG